MATKFNKSYFYRQVKNLNLKNVQMKRWNEKGSTTIYWRDLYNEYSGTVNNDVQLDIYLFLENPSKGDKQRSINFTMNNMPNETKFINVLRGENRKITKEELTDFNILRHATRSRLIVNKTTINTIEKLVNYVKNDIYPDYSGAGNLQYIGYSITKMYNAIEHWENMELRGGISHLCAFNNVRCENEHDDKCVEHYIEKNQIFSKYISLLKGNTVKDLIDFFEAVKEKESFTYGIYNYDGKIQYGVMEADYNIICSHNHVSIIDGKRLIRTQPSKKQIIYMELRELNKKFIELLNDGIIPCNIIPTCSVDDEKIHVQMFETKKEIYLSNPYYEHVCKVFKDMKLNNAVIPYDIQDDIQLASIIASQRINRTVDSFGFPYKYSPITPLYRCSNSLYINSRNNHNDSILSIDKIGAYRNCLNELPFVLKFDLFRNKIRDYKQGELLINTNLYIAKLISYKGTTPNILMSEEGIYEQYYLEFCALNGFNFIIEKVIECNKEINYYIDIIDEIMKLPKKFEKKTMVNSLIGKMGINIGKDTIRMNKYSHVITNDEEIRTDAHITCEINEDYSIINTADDKKINMYNKQPIFYQVRNKHNFNMFNAMKDMEITYDNLLQIKTDSLVFISKTYNKHYSYALNNGFRIENKYKMLQKPISIITKEKVRDLYEKCTQLSSIQSVFAGVGKTTTVQKMLSNPTCANIKQLLVDSNDELIKQLKVLIHKKNYCVLTPTHKVRIAYNEFENVEVNTKYTEMNIIPKQKLIIIDEFGMLTTKKMYRLILECKLAGKIIISIGDFTQLKPVIGHMNLTEQLKTLLFNSTKTNLNTNYRNNFTEEYYNKIKNEMTINEAIDEVYKYNVDRFEAEKIITYKNDTKNKYNNKMIIDLYHLQNANYVVIKAIKDIKKGDIMTLEKANEFIETYNKTKGVDDDTLTFFDIFRINHRVKGMKYICLTNKYSKDEIINGTELIYDYTDDKKYVHFENTKFIINEKVFNTITNFDFNYASTLHKVQGMSIKSYHFAEEDRYILSKLSECNNICYTIISRIKN